MRTLIITISLISLILCEDSCSSKTQSQCTSDSSCTWTGGKCSGDSGTTCSSVTVDTTCKTTTYTGTIKCQFTPAVPETCTGTISCAALNNEDKCGYATGCEWDGTGGTCSGSSSKTCADFASDSTKCEAVGCSHSDAVAAKCEGDGTCTSHTTSSSDCTGTTYSGSSTCTWTDPSCTSKNTDTNTNTNNNNNNNNDDNGVSFIKSSKVIFAIFALLF